MKKIFLKLSLLTLTFFFDTSLFAQSNIFFFDSTWVGYNTGTDYNSSFPYGSTLGDLDNDGDSDMVVTQWPFANGFKLMQNTGGGNFQESGYFASQSASFDILIGDFNNDGIKDVVTCNYGTFGSGNSIALFLNQGNGVFSQPINYLSGNSPAGIASADLDNDGDLDLAVSNHLFSAGTVSILLNNGNGTFASPLSFPAGERAWDIAIGKMNNDNLPDIAVGNGGQKINILLNTGGNNFSNRAEYQVVASESGSGSEELGNFLISIAIADIDNDNDNDIIYGPGKRFTGSYDHGSIALFRNQGTGILVSPQYLEMLPFTLSVADIETADFNSDGWKDIVIASYIGRAGDGYMVFMNNGSGNFQEPFLRAAGQYTTDVMTGDADNDGKIDILTCDHSTLMVTFHKNYGNGHFPSPAQFPTNSFIASFIDAADIDADGDLDVLTSGTGAAGGDSEPAILKNNGNGTFTSGVIYSVRYGGIQGKLRDLNGDGRPDILFATSANSIPYDFHFAINNGDGTFGAVQTRPINSCGWFDINAADLDNDGDLDVVITENKSCPNVPNSGYRIFICINNGNAVFSNPIIKLSTSPFPSALEINDFNKDGKLDLATAHGLSIDIHLGLGNGDFMQSVPYPTDPRTFDICVSDFNNDGKLDLASCHQSDSESVNVMLGNGNGTFQPRQYYFAPSSSDLRNQSGITTGDVDNDGDKDIILAGSSSNAMSVYLNNGSGTSFDFKTRYGAYYYSFAPFFADFNGDRRADIAYVAGLLPSGGPSALSILRGKTTELITSEKKLNLTTLIEGFYNPSLNKMVKDSITVYLRNISSPYSTIDSSKELLDTTGKGTFYFDNAINGVAYYIIVKHRNSIETWSSAGNSFVSNELTYNFTTSSTQAFGNNLKLVDDTPIRFAIYSGDVNQDEIIDASDISLIDNDAYSSITGYVVTDLTGDNFVDASDLSMVENNSINNISLIRPL